MTPEQEKMALDRLAGELATLKIMLRQLRAEGRIFLVCPMSRSTHGKGPLRYAAPCVSGDHINWASCSGDVLPPSPPAEKATARQDQAGKSSTGDGTANAGRSNAAAK